ncbi:site-specific integrase [Sulfitobacter sp. 1A15299]|uniref:site-specific integrase n=1 Tax=Sulfitobacter sp. 1A15299 TaxID=3368598 RepID=UPI0037471FC0
MSHRTQVSSKNLLQEISRDRAAGSPFAFRAGLPAQPRPTESSGSSEIASSRQPKQSKRTQNSTRADTFPTVEDCSNEPFISARTPKDGLPRYCAQIRRRTDGGSINTSKTFSSLKDAKNWRDDTLAQIQLGLLAPKQGEGSKTAPRVCDLIQKRKDKGRSVEKTATQNLEFWINHPRCQVPASAIDLKWFQNAAEDLLKLEMTPQTAATYMTMLASSLKWAAERDEDVPYDVIVRAMKVLWHDEILARSEERERRPTLDELDLIFRAVLANKRQKIPVITISVFAIFSCRRLSEICRLRWSDLNVTDRKILVREMKHPRKKRTNDVWVKLTPQAMKIILSMPKTSEFIFPYNPRSVGTAFRRHRQRVKIDDLRFHDLRHEGISRLFEKGKRDHFVMKTSGHQSRSCLDRYVNVEKKGDKFKNWHWLDWVLEYLAST